MDEDKIVQNMVEFIKEKERDFHIASLSRTNKNLNNNVLKSNTIHSIVMKIEKELENENN